MKNILLIITIGIIIYIAPSYALSTIVSNTINSKVDVYKSYNYTVQRMGLYPKEGDLLDYFTTEVNSKYIKYTLGKYKLQNSVLEVVVNKSNNQISEINIISKNNLGFWKNEDFISKMIISIAMMNPNLSLSKIYEIRNDLRMAYFKNKDNSKVIMDNDTLRYTSYQDSNKHTASISFNKQSEELLMVNQKSYN